MNQSTETFLQFEERIVTLAALNELVGLAMQLPAVPIWELTDVFSGLLSSSMS